MISFYFVPLQKKKKKTIFTPIIIMPTMITFLCLGICHVQNIFGAPTCMVIKGSVEMSTPSLLEIVPNFVFLPFQLRPIQGR